MDTASRRWKPAKHPEQLSEAATVAAVIDLVAEHRRYAAFVELCDLTLMVAADQRLPLL